MSTAFGGSETNFSAMSPNPLAISDIAHFATVVVDETGTEAASGTAVGVVELAVAPNPAPIPVVRVNHPFLFLIRGNTSGTIFFMGRITDPR
jgi:serpin B